ncbi:MAG: xanthine dehydrogenase family protein molybdopterin-binding subunit [Betaproteobacteria bacterium]|nr:xanthine dehydrogenase family protein molybdopterin-binding subunit [Betaproteobacteria bacterium]
MRVQTEGIRPATALIGASVPRSAARRLVAGRGRYVDDLRWPQLLHAAFLRSPYAHADFRIVDTSRAAHAALAVIDGAQIATVCRPWTTKLATWPQHVSAPQLPLAMGRAVYQGQPVALVIAASRAAAEDAALLIDVEWSERSSVARWRDALAEGASPVHPALGSNLAFAHAIESGDAVHAFGAAHRIIKRTFRFPRLTGVCLEPRAIAAEFDPTSRRLTVCASTQVPHQLRAMLAAQLHLNESDVRVIVPDVGGGFGVKLHAYDDELAVISAAVLLGRPVKWVCDRLEAFTSDVHAREHEVNAEIAVAADGALVGLRVDVVAEAGAYSIYPRSSVLEGMQAIGMTGAPYDLAAYSARLRVVYENKVNTGSYRGVGQPIACGVTEQLIDAAAQSLGIDPAAMRERTLRRGAPTGGKTAGGQDMDALSQHGCLARLLARMDYDGLRRQQATDRAEGRYLGIGLAAFLEQTSPGAGFYGTNNVSISAADGCMLRIEQDGTFTCVTSSLDQGQGVETGLTQLIASALSVPMSAVRIVTGDTAVSAVGGGTFASRGLTIGGEAALRAAYAMRDRLLRVAAVLWECEPASLRLAGGELRAAEGRRQMSLEELARVLHFQQYKIPHGTEAQPLVVAHYVPARPYYFANGVQASLMSVDIETGFIRLLGHWIVEDCGRLINPLLVDEQLRGGIVQGIGAALFEELRYDERGQLTNASMMDYLVPMAFEMPDISVDHIETPVAGTLLGGKGVGEAGTIGAGAAVANALNDALSPFHCVLTHQPFTPERVLRGLGKVA